MIEPGLGRDDRRAVYALAAAVAALSAATLWPLLTVHWWLNHDGAWPLARTLAYADAWARGSVYPRWAHDFYGGFGSPIFNFYPPGLSACGAALVTLGVPVAVSLKIVVAVAMAFGTVGAFALARAETRRTDAAVVAAAAFAAAPYFFVDLYIRGDLAESCATCLLPWALWSVRALDRAPSEGKPRAAALVAVTLAAVIVTHTLTGLWTLVLATAFALPGAVRAWRGQARDQVVAYASCIFGAIAIAGVYLLPAALERRFVRMDEMTGGYYVSAAHLVEPWRFFRFNFFELISDGSLGHSIRMPFSIGEPLALALALVTLQGIRLRGRRWRVLPWWLAVVALLLAITPVSAPLWALPTLPAFTQFPWRLLAHVRACGAIVVGFAYASTISEKWRPRLLLALVLALAMLASTYRFAHTVVVTRVDPAYETPGLMTKRLVSTTALHEYAPANSSPPSGPRTSLAQVATGDATLSRVWEERGRYHLIVEARTAADVDVQVFWFPGWRADVVSGPKEITLGASTTGLLRVHYKEAGRYEVLVRFGSTPVRTLGGIFTVLGIIGIWPALELLRRLRGRAGSPERLRALSRP